MTPQTEAFRTMAQTVTAQVASDILHGRLAPGVKLKLMDLCATYAAGMSPLREALASLAGRGLVVQDGQRGFRVAPASLEDFADVVATRRRIETMALRLSIDHGDTAWEAEILSSYHMLSQQPRSPERLIDEAWEFRHSRFHTVLVSACGSDRLLRYCEGLHQQFDRYRRIAVLARGAHASLTAVDAALVDAAIQRRADEAAALLDAHVAESGEAVTLMLREQGFSKR